MLIHRLLKPGVDQRIKPMFERSDIVAEFFEDVAGDFDASAGAAVEVDDLVFGRLTSVR